MKNEKSIKAKSPDAAKKRKKAPSPIKTTPEELLKTEELYTRLVDTIPDSIIRTDLTGKILFVNNYTLLMSGYKRDEIVGRNILAFVPEEEHERMVKNILLLMEHGLGPREYNLIMKDGRKTPFEIHADVLRNEDGTPFGIVSVCRNINERKRTEAILREKDEHLRGITENLPGIIFQFYAKDSGEFGVSYFSKPLGDFSEVVENVDTAKQEDVFPLFISSIHEEDRESFLNSIKKAVEKGTAWNFEGRLNTVSGKIIWIQGMSTPARHEDQTVFDGILLNVTKRKRAEDELRESEKKYRLITEKMTDIVWIADVNLRTVYVTPSVKTVLGFTQEERMRQTVDQQLTPDSLSIAMETMARELAIEKQGQGDPDKIVTLILEYYHKDGSTRWMETITSALRNDRGVAIGIHGVSRDITQRRKAEDELRESEELFRNYLECAPDGVYMSDLKGTFLYGNRKSEEIIGYKREELIGKNFFELNVLTEKALNKAIQWLQANMEGRPTDPDEIELIRKDGQIVPVEINTAVIQRMGQNIVLAFVRDITERKKAEAELTKLASVVKFSSELVNLATLDGKMIFLNEAGGRILGIEPEKVGEHFIMDVISEPFLPTVHQEIIPALRAGNNWEGRLQYRNIQTGVLTDVYAVTFNIKDAVTGATICLANVSHNITERKRAEEALKRSEAKYRNIFENAMEGIYQVTPEGKFITANATLARMAGYDSPEDFIESIDDIQSQLYVHPEDRDRFLEIMKTKGIVEDFEVEFYRKDRSIFWVVLNARMVKDEQGKFLYNEGLIEDITLRKQAEEKLKQSLERLKKAVSTTIQVLVSALEVRDPYTAGHQSRSADLACAIAAEMGLSQEQTDGIHMAGIIHDIGKLSIPVEILSKPTKLTSLEFSLIKEHSRSGFEMLKDVEPSWPLAEIVYQHHERLNGTGYPRNLKGDEILIEARILCVADVVEAMASHRPYRASLGIEAALEEIEKNRGILYDEKVVDACLRLFREKGYELA